MPSETLMTVKILTWAIGGLFVFVGAVAGLCIRMGLLMFGWRREIDKATADNKTRICTLVQWKEDHTEEALRIRDELRSQREKISKLGK